MHGAHVYAYGRPVALVGGAGEVNNLSPEKYRERMNLIIAGEVDAINRTFADTRPGRDTPAKTSINRTGLLDGRSSPTG